MCYINTWPTFDLSGLDLPKRFAQTRDDKSQPCWKLRDLIFGPTTSSSPNITTWPSHHLLCKRHARSWTWVAGFCPYGRKWRWEPQNVSRWFGPFMQLEQFSLTLLRESSLPFMDAQTMLSPDSRTFFKQWCYKDLLAVFMKMNWEICFPMIVLSPGKGGVHHVCHHVLQRYLRSGATKRMYFWFWTVFSIPLAQQPI